MRKALLRMYLRMCSLFIKDKRARREFRDHMKDRIHEKLYKRQKWGVAYSVFDGEELLEASVRNIRPHVDYICVVWQRVSWYGSPVHDEVLPLITKLKEEGLVNEVLEYEVNLKLKAGRNETRKRNMGLQAARKAGCTYFMAMDTDEFYKADEIENAKHYLIKHGITHSYCAQTIYGKQPTQMIMATMSCCPFFSRLTYWSKHQNDPHSVAQADPTRKISHIPWWRGGSRHFFVHQVKMNHFSFIRKDLQRKIDNSSGENASEKTQHRLNQCDILNCPDYFGLHEVMQNFH